MLSTISLESSVRRILVEKRQGFDLEAKALKKDLIESLHIDTIENVRILNRYDIEGIYGEVYENAAKTIFSEPNLDIVYHETLEFNEGKRVFAIEYLPGQYDQRGDWAAQCIQIVNEGNRPEINTAKLYILTGNITDEQFDKIKDYIINPVDSREASLEKTESLKMETEMPTEVEILDGFIDLNELRRNITDKTILVSIMFANNEIGTIEPIEEIAEIAKQRGIIFHTDAVQAVGHVPIDVKELNVDLMSMSSHKIYGPKGIGALYIKTGTKLHSFVHGGAQERRRRAGTENMPSIVGYGKAAELAKTNMDEHIERLTSLRTKLIDGILEKIPYTRVNGSLENRLPGNVNFSFEFIEGEGILLMLDMLGIAASSGSACTSGSLDPSHVLMAIGLPHEIAHGSLRLSIGDFTTEEDIDYIIEKLPAVIERLRMMSPLYDAVTKQK